MFWTVTLSLLSGMGQLLKLFFLTLLFSLPLGLLIAFALRSRCKPPWTACGSSCLKRYTGMPGGPPRKAAATTS